MPGSAGISGSPGPGRPVDSGGGSSLWSAAMSKIRGGLGAVVPDVARDVTKSVYDNTAGKVFAADRWLYSHVISHPLAAVATVENPFSDAFLHPQQAWEDTTDVSAGQALSANPLTRFAVGQVAPAFIPAGANAQAQAGVDSGGLFGFAGFDPTVDADRKAVFEDTRTGKQMSGALDLGLSWYGDPLFIAGKAAKVTVINKVANIGDKTETVAQTTARTLDPNDAAMQSWLTKKLPSASAWLSDPIVRKSAQPATLAGALHGAETVEDKALIYRAARGDLDALRALDAERKAVGDALKDAKGDLSELEDLQKAKNPLSWATDEGELADYAGIVDDLAKRDKWLAAATNRDNNLFGSMSAYGVSRSAALEKVRAASGATRANIKNGYWAETHSQLAPGTRVVKALRWLGGDAPNGLVPIAGGDLNSAHREMLATLQKAGADQALTQKWLDRFVTAKDETERLQIATDMDNELVLKVATDAGMSEKAAKRFLKTQGALRRKAAAQFKEKGYLVLEDGKVLKKTAQIDTQLAKAVPMTDFALMRKALKKKSVKEAAENGEWMKAMEGAGLSTLEAVDTGLSALVQLWKPTVLLRLGYPIRNVGESQIAAFARTGSLVGDPIGGTGHIMQNMARRAKYRGAAMSERKAKALIRDSQADFQAAHESETQFLADLAAQRAEVESQIKKHAKKATKKGMSEKRAAQIDDLHSRLEVIDGDTLNTQKFIDHIEAQQEEFRRAMDQVSRKPLNLTRSGEGRRMSGGYVVDQAGYGSYGDIARALVSGERTQQALNHGMESNRARSRWLARELTPTGSFSVSPEDANYLESLTHLINTQFRESPWVVQLMEGKSAPEVAQWLKTDGVDVLSKMRWQDDEVLKRVERIDDMLTRYLPDEELRLKAAHGEVTKAYVEARIMGRQLSPIHGEEVGELIGYGGKATHRVLDGLDRVYAKAFHIIGTLPEDAMARWPLYSKMYDQRIDQLIQENADTLAGMSAKEQRDAIDLIQRGAHSHALSEVNRTIYTIEQRSNIANALRYASPFLQVTMNRFGFYGRMAVENPDNMAHIFLAYHLVPAEKNAFGDEQVNLTVPGPIADFLNIPDGTKIPLSKKSLNLIGQGSPWYNPGFGPPVTIPVGYIVRQSGDDSSWMAQTILPYGAGSSIKDQLLPTTMRRFLDKGRNTEQWGEDYRLVASNEIFRYKAGLRDAPSNEELIGKADGLGWIRFLSSAVMPVSTSISSPLQPQIDYYRALQKADYKSADAKFLAKFPDYYEYMISLTKNPTGVDANRTAVARLNKYSETAYQITQAGGDPSIVGLIANDPSHQEFEQSAYNYEKGNPAFAGAGSDIRQDTNAIDAIKQREASRGWIEYQKLSATVQGMLDARGLKSITQSGAEDIAAMKSVSLTKIAQDYPAWSDDYQSRDGSYYARNARSFTALLSNPALIDDPVTGKWAPAAQQYMTLRNWVVTQLAERKKNGESGAFDAKSNSDLAAVWSIQTAKLNQNPAWAEVFKRYFENDNMLPDGVNN